MPFSINCGHLKLSEHELKTKGMAQRLKMLRTPDQDTQYEHKQYIQHLQQMRQTICYVYNIIYKQSLNMLLQKPLIVLDLSTM